ncbi:MAG: hypothetical protein M1827_003594 [Pycnora praestabilis]|nr:MAG: hypothetical protein M1827_003594 [Pycnora praestabilis]
MPHSNKELRANNASPKFAAPPNASSITLIEIAISSGRRVAIYFSTRFPRSSGETCGSGVHYTGKRIVSSNSNTLSQKNAYKVIFVSFETLQKPAGVDVFIKARRKKPEELQSELSILGQPAIRNLLIIDTLHPLCARIASTLSGFLSSLINPHTSLVAVYHVDIPLAASSSLYAPSPLTLLKYLSTTILSTHSLNHVFAKKAARDKSLAEPLFGLAEETEGVVVGLGANDKRGMVLEMEYRRKSGRGVRERFFLPSPPTNPAPGKERDKERIMLLEDHPLYGQPPSDGSVGGAGEGDMDTTFSLGLTEKQRQDREGVVLPYFDAQREEGGVGEGGRILYNMGEEDDFDEEEDEI